MSRDINNHNEIINKVAQSGLVTIDLEELFPQGERVAFDIKELLFEGLILREKFFREFIKKNNWEYYKDKHVALYCSNDAIVPTWAYMLIATYLQPFAKMVVYGSLEQLECIIFRYELQKINFNNYLNASVVIKGCSKKSIPIDTYIYLTELLKPVAKSIMFGEPCSTVPLYKKKV
jgi:hypothetical protein